MRQYYFPFIFLNYVRVHVCVCEGLRAIVGTWRGMRPPW